MCGEIEQGAELLSSQPHAYKLAMKEIQMTKNLRKHTKESHTMKINPPSHDSRTIGYHRRYRYPNRGDGGYQDETCDGKNRYSREVSIRGQPPISLAEQ